MNNMPKTACNIAPLSQRYRLFGQENNVDIVGVAGSIPATPTIQTSEYKELPPAHTKFPLGSANLVERFWTKVDIRSVDDCWEWKAAKTGNGYGNFKSGAFGNIPSHRMAYWISTGNDPDRILVRHKCDNPLCCNPSHLEPGSAKDNARDKVERGRHRNRYTGPLGRGPFVEWTTPPPT